MRIVTQLHRTFPCGWLMVAALAVTSILLTGVACAERQMVERLLNGPPRTSISRSVDSLRDIAFRRESVGSRPGYFYGAPMLAMASKGPAVGDVVTVLPTGCVPTAAGGLLYHRCSRTWYLPQYIGTSLTYIVVDPVVQ